MPGVPFAGHFDGGNYTISGINYECGNRGGIGVFGWVSAQGSVSNLRVDRCTFLSEGIGTGAVVGHNQGLISKCESTSNQVLFTKYNGGGIVGNLASKTVKYCVNQGNIISSKAAGGIYGYSSTSPVMTGCINTGIVTSVPTTDYGALGGGGTATSAKFTDNYYDGQIMPVGAIRRRTAEGCTALTTAQLCYTTVTAGLPTDAFDFAEGVYPLLKAHKNAASTTALRSMVMTLPQGMTLADVTADAAGFWATGRSENLKNSYNAGPVSGKNFVSGFIGNFSTKVNISGCYAAAPVTVTDESGTAAPFLLSTPSGENSYADNYYNNTLCTATGGYTEVATGKSTKEMLDFAPNAAYQATPACYPTLKSMDKCIPGNFAAAQLCFKTDEENLSNVLNDMTIGLLDGVVWTCPPELKIEDNKVVIVKSDAKGVQGWIQKQGGELSYRYNLVINVDTGIAEIEGSDIAAREYYTPDGLRVHKPRPGQIIVVKTIYTDGKVTVQRVAYGR